MYEFFLEGGTHSRLIELLVFFFYSCIYLHFYRPNSYPLLFGITSLFLSFYIFLARQPAQHFNFLSLVFFENLIGIIFFCFCLWTQSIRATLARVLYTYFLGNNFISKRRLIIKILISEVNYL